MNATLPQQYHNSSYQGDIHNGQQFRWGVEGFRTL